MKVTIQRAAELAGVEKDRHSKSGASDALRCLDRLYQTGHLSQAWVFRRHCRDHAYWLPLEREG